MKYLLFLLVAAAGLGASTALATDWHPPVHPTTTGDHPPTTTGDHECDHQCPPPPPAVTVTVTEPAHPAETTTVERRVEVPTDRIVYVDRIVEKRVEVPVEKIVERVVRVPVMKVIYRTKWKTRTVVKNIVRTKVIHDRCPPPKVCCEGKG